MCGSTIRIRSSRWSSLPASRRLIVSASSQPPIPLEIVQQRIRFVPGAAPEGHNLANKAAMISGFDDVDHPAVGPRERLRKNRRAGLGEEMLDAFEGGRRAGSEAGELIGYELLCPGQNAHCDHSTV